MKVVVLSVDIDFATKRVEAIEIEGDDKYMEIVNRIKDWNEKKHAGRTWEILEGIPTRLAEYFIEQQERDRETRTRERDDIKDYFRDAEKAIENLETIWNEKY